ncbi:MAG: twin-arginine translocation signal domain-containing protein [Planctomycetes bacterium]|nr:twin-arginine translocation signal domain-containing protein [Planctomycetota bacterium]
MSQHLTTPATRRTFLKHLAMAAGGAVLVPLVTSCTTEPAKTKTAAKSGAGASADPMAVPQSKPEGWNAIEYNKVRGNAGKIPKTYHASINGPDGVKKHLGKHLPYVPAVDAKLVPAGYLAIMWGDPKLGYTKHPNAAKSDANKAGHWYNWIEVRKATDGEAIAQKSEYATWPATGDVKAAGYLVEGEGDMAAEKGTHTIYLAKLPSDVKKGDLVRLHAHCLTHGEYVDFLTV